MKYILERINKAKVDFLGGRKKINKYLAMLTKKKKRKKAYISSNRN